MKGMVPDDERKNPYVELSQAMADIVVKAVKFHLSSIYSKLGATNRIEAVRIGVGHGLIAL